MFPSAASHTHGSASAQKERRAGPARQVVLADREPAFLVGLQSVIRSIPEVECCAIAEDSRALVDAITRWQPDIVVLGFVLRCGRDVLSLQNSIRSAHPAVVQIVLIPPDFEWMRPRFADAGVLTLLPRTAPVEAISHAVNSARNGGPKPGKSKAEHNGGTPQGVERGDFVRLTDREREIFRLFAERKSYKEISALLGISPRTVDAHRQRIKVKLNIDSARSLHQLADAYTTWEST